MLIRPGRHSGRRTFAKPNAERSITSCFVDFGRCLHACSAWPAGHLWYWSSGNAVTVPDRSVSVGFTIILLAVFAFVFVRPAPPICFDNGRPYIDVYIRSCRQVTSLDIPGDGYASLACLTKTPDLREVTASSVCSWRKKPSFAKTWRYKTTVAGYEGIVYFVWKFWHPNSNRWISGYNVV